MKDVHIVKLYSTQIWNSTTIGIVSIPLVVWTNTFGIPLNIGKWHWNTVIRTIWRNLLADTLSSCRSTPGFPRLPTDLWLLERMAVQMWSPFRSLHFVSAPHVPKNKVSNVREDHLQNWFPPAGRYLRCSLDHCTEFLTGPSPESSTALP